MKGKLTGMNESSATVTVGDASSVVSRVVQSCNTHAVLAPFGSTRYSLAPLSQELTTSFYFAGRSLSSNVLVLIQIDSTSGRVLVNCEKMILGSVILKVVKNVFA